MKDGIILILLVVILLMALLGDQRRSPVGVIQDVSAKFVKADFQQCVMLNPGPLTAPPPGKVRTDHRSRDGGLA
jgi:hypothetical protein